MFKRKPKILQNCIGVICLLLLVPTLSWGVLKKQFSYTALWGSAMPGNVSSVFLNFSRPVIDAQMLAFFGQGNRNYQAIFTTRPGFLKAEVSNNRELPLGAGTLNSFVGSAKQEETAESALHRLTLSTKRGSIAFMATGPEDNQGVYRLSSTSLHTVANQKTPVPKGKGQFVKLGSPELVNSQCVAFWGEGSKQQGLFLSNSKGHLKPLVTKGGKLGGKDLKVTKIDNFDVGYRSQDCGKSSFQYAFVASDKNGDPILYKTQQGKKSQYKTLVDSSTSIPGNYVGFFTDIKQISYDTQKDRIAFVGHGIIDQQGLFIIDQGKVEKLVTQDDLLPKSPGSFQTFGHPNLRGHNIVFEATGSHNVQGVYLVNMQGDQFKILTNQDKLNGKNIASVEISHQAFIGKRVVMLVTYENGRKGIYTAKLHSAAF